ncbi:hypothetical protein PZB74_17895 [Porifericola rhodea]|uniref:hypothetical protein n=1 Tax=Porifericola rhodea TaxID=930972 RepID=UPI002664FCDB|nr:hypothetical protein [Porifericola rhodea]WKN30831.1 hypothetical protein PZB74_17895 [Porifericola rhodea]
MLIHNLLVFKKYAAYLLHKTILFFTLLILLYCTAPQAHAQAEMTAWGNLQGIRMEGQLMEFESSIKLVKPEWSYEHQTAKERQRPQFKREGNTQIVNTQLDSIFFTKAVSDTEAGKASIHLKLDAQATRTLEGAYLCLELPARYYARAEVELINTTSLKLNESRKSGKNELLKAPAQGVRISASLRSIEVKMDQPSTIIVKESDDNKGDILLYLPIWEGMLSKGTTAEKSFSISVDGEIDHTAATFTLYPTQQGRPFDGLGGNFRIQNAKVDPQVIAYSLENLRVSWGRVELPWRQWHPEENTNPLKEAQNGKLHPKVKDAIEMAQKLDQQGIPLMLAIWFPPEWAADGPLTPGRQPNGYFGNLLDTTKMEQIYESIGSYIQFLKEEYGVETVMFSFNEADLGIDVRQTAEQHTAFMKGFGAWLREHGLQTRFLLGDTADANGYAFIDHAMEDPAARPFIGAVSFHSWRGWATPTLKKWHAAAAQLGVPLVVGEGSIDAAAWRYPQIFQESIYAMEEIKLYTRMLAICQPLTILQWQLTADYSPLVGGGIYGNNEPLRPTQRFWNLKQLASTPQGLCALPIQSSHAAVSCAALGDKDKGSYAIHLVNTGAKREATIQGLPSSVKKLSLYFTNKENNMKKGRSVNVKNGKASFTMEANSYISLMTD